MSCVLAPPPSAPNQKSSLCHSWFLRPRPLLAAAAAIPTEHQWGCVVALFHESRMQCVTWFRSLCLSLSPIRVCLFPLASEYSECPFQLYKLCYPVVRCCYGWRALDWQWRWPMDVDASSRLNDGNKTSQKIGGCVHVIHNSLRLSPSSSPNVVSMQSQNSMNCSISVPAGLLLVHSLYRLRHYTAFLPVE